jgi:hypothetical protein
MANKLLSTVTDHLYLLLFCVSAGSIVPRGSLNKTIIRFGYLMQESAPPYRVGAINLAIRNAQSDGLLQGYSFRFEIYSWLKYIGLRAGFQITAKWPYLRPGKTCETAKNFRLGVRIRPRKCLKRPFFDRWTYARNKKDFVISPVPHYPSPSASATGIH